jgi:hypothetical protein
VLKAANPDHVPRDFARFAPSLPRLPTSASIPEPAEDHAALIAACDIVLSPHRAQGLGFVPAEAMRLGKSVIATGWSGNIVSTAAQVCRSIPRIRPGPDCATDYRKRGGGQRRHQAVAHQGGVCIVDEAERAALGLPAS